MRDFKIMFNNANIIDSGNFNETEDIKSEIVAEINCMRGHMEAIRDAVAGCEYAKRVDSVFCHLSDLESWLIRLDEKLLGQNTKIKMDS